MRKPATVTDAYVLAEQDLRTHQLLEQASHEDDTGERERLYNLVILENRRLAAGLARRFEHRGMEHDDLVQVAFLGLVQAVRRYRPGVGPGFTAYAVPTIVGELKRHFRDHGWAVRPPRALQELYRNVRRATTDLVQTLQREPTSEEIAALLGVPTRSVRLAQQLDSQYVTLSLDCDWSDHGSGLPLGDLLPDPTDPFGVVEDAVTLHPVLDELDENDRILIRLRFVDRLTQSEIGDHLAVSQMQVSRLLRDLLDRLRSQLGELQPQS